MFSQHKLARIFFSTIILILLALFIAIYWYSVPLIKKEVYQVERNSSRLVLNNIFELASRMHLNLESYRQEAIGAHKRNLISVISLAESYVKDSLNNAKKNNLSKEQALESVFEGLRHFTYGRDDYIWVANYDAKILSHPDPRFHGTDASQLKDAKGELIIPRVIDKVVEKGEGFYQYIWHRLSKQEEVEKISYIKYFPEWDFFIGSGVYLDDIEEEIKLRKAKAIKELRQALNQIVIAKTGYLFIFDKQGNMLAHPNPNIDKTNALLLKDPATNQSILKELIDVADTGKELSYLWDRPTDPNNYIYEKLSLVRHLEGFDWYICSSVYVDELQSSSELLSKRLLTIGLIALFFAIILAFLFVKWVTRPITALASVAAKVTKGDLSVKSGIERSDELGILAHAFDSMVSRLRNSIETLDSKVASRTKALEHTNVQLQAAVTSTQQAQQQLTIVEARQRRILDSLPAQISYVDQHLHYLFANSKYSEQFNIDKPSIVGMPMLEVIGLSMLSDISPHIQQCLNGEEVTFNYTLVTSGKEMITKCVLIPDFSPENTVIGILNLTIDVTTEKQAERQLAEAQRMNAVGQLAGGLAHDFNNILTIILGNLIAAEEQCSNNTTLLKRLSPAIRAARRGGNITNRLLAFSRRQSLIPCAINLAELLEETVELLKGSLPSNINVFYDLQNQTLTPYADPGPLENCLINIVLNAKDAMPKGGHIEIRVSDKTVSDYLLYDDVVEPAQYVEISVIDSGTGFSDDAIKMAFEPFFTTKSKGKGAGLGLSMVYGFIKQSRGYIKLENPHQGGAKIALLLPAQEAITPENNQSVSTSSFHVDDFQGQLMLLVEDDEDVRNIVREQLVSQGFNVIEAADADEAAQLINSIDELYGMVSDISMPGEQNGFNLATMLKARSPNSKIVLMSGYAFEGLEDDNESPQYQVLKKPFDAHALHTALNEACNE
ncbi:cache domain-containing protein [Alkalimarinus coralli]|uniref:cache domain-containing protein n=1 Tax=Alkalimarinus coralli TaxID=2935863 RepID=UPI00202B6029|nr:cache domain-containing protein [Alkalimarinus coralli]